MRRISEEEARALVRESAERLMPRAEALTLDGFGHGVSFSKKVFVPLTRLCRDVCGYCTFARPPRSGSRRSATMECMTSANRPRTRSCSPAGKSPTMRLTA